MSEKKDLDHQEVQFDGMVGPTYSYSGLADGNIASEKSKGKISNPKQALLQGLKKARDLSNLGVTQAILPPDARPYLQPLRKLGYRGTDEEIIKKVGDENPELLASVMSSASMWTANAATVAPSIDTEDGRLHITPASLVSQFHRSLEGTSTRRMLQQVLGNAGIIHDPVHLHPDLGDEGAANHMRFASKHNEPGTHVFVYGRDPGNPANQDPKKYIARQTLMASQAVARINQLPQPKVIYAQQSPVAIDAGVFHNDVIGTNNQMVFLYHELAYADPERLLHDLRSKTQGDIYVAMAKNDQLSLQDAIDTYVFNSQIITLPASGDMVIIAPQEVAENSAATDYLQRVIDDTANPINAVQYFDLKQSMKNGGGPACLRLRIVLSAQERASIRGRIFLDDALYQDLKTWGEKYYRDRLSINDLRDPQLTRESQEALDALTAILRLPSDFYDFQKNGKAVTSGSKPPLPTGADYDPEDVDPDSIRIEG